MGRHGDAECMTGSIVPYMPFIAFVSGLIQAWSLWRIGRRLKEISPSDWARVGSPDTRAFRIQKDFNYEIEQWIAKLRLGISVFIPMYITLHDREFKAYVWVYRVSIIVLVASLLSWRFL